MHNSYISSTVLSLRSKGSFSFSINDYSNLLSERFDTTPSSSSNCCSCCSCCTSCATHNKLYINPCFVPGLRQSTLIQWRTRRRRLVLAGGNGYFYRFPVYDLDRDYYQVSCSVKESYGCGTTDRRTGRFRCRVFEEKNDGYQLDCVDDAEAVISLLSEELGEECLGSRERSEISYKKVEVKKRSKPRGECYLKNNKRAEVERRLNSGKRGYRGNRKRVEIGSKEDNGHENYEGKKLTFESDLLESDSRCQYGSVTLQSKGEVHGRNEDREDSSREEGHRGRRKSSSCSSYYSFSSLENFESDTEVKDEDFGFVEEVSSSIDDLGSGTGGQSEVRALEEFRRHRSDKAAGEEILEQKYSAAGNNIDRDSPKMLEKRLIEVTVREKQSREGSSTKEGKMLRTSHEGYVKASSPQKHFGVDEKESVFTVNLDHRRKKQHIQQICGNDAKMITHSQKRFSGREEKMMGSGLRSGKKNRAFSWLCWLNGAGKATDSLSLIEQSESGFTSEVTGSTSAEAEFGWNLDGSSHGTNSEMAPETSLSLQERSIHGSSLMKEVSEAGNIIISGSGSREQIKQPDSLIINEQLGSLGKDGELKQRKLQRNKQVLRDRFDEWEEAYVLETEQRKNDEMFMREALLEANKAADIWEVPVGAVLVQEGKIIARGCNLVEELRDSTAHAEMICIREASKLLNSWRLAGTTLYVTLEPCPMCAGAILQARIDTLVWGAPNKLLGADGSWIRLFPDGGNGSELSDKPAAPVHPFHPKMKIRRGVLPSECADVMQQFFQLRRRKKEKNAETSPPPSCLPIRGHPSKALAKMHDIFHIMFCL
ncbi:tRNA(adenine(34)) deaminase, chloroplastic [Carica papaya]|uniref:tRNA(adenine(34)) deaminase, chloroplastic n=1 Tax=Carica papaya TaxID=3649 RepID=UPI000B8C833D|nr:tRNA(adenine(34)) deaminase, chloroplastic [Carica papaya]